MLDIKPLNDASLNCIENAYMSFLEWMGKDFNLIYSETWRFNYSNSQENMIFGERISYGVPHISELVLKYFGVKSAFHFEFEIEDLLKTIKYETSNNRPLIMRVENKKYKRSFLVVGYDEDIDAIYYFEPAISTDEKPSVLKREDFPIIQNFITFTIEECPKQQNDWRNILWDNLNCLISSNSFNKIRELAKDIKNVELLIEEFNTNVDINDMHLKYKLKMTSLGRKKFGNFIKYIAVKYNLNLDILEFKEMLNSVAIMWEAIRSLLTKMYFVKNKDTILDKVQVNLNSIADEEERIARKLLEFINNYDSVQNSPQILNSNYNDCFSKESDNTINQLTYVDLEPIFNNRAFGNLNESENANFDGSGYYYCSDNIPEDGRLYFEDIEFRFVKSYNDNVFCLGQCIKVKDNFYKSIMILGSAENGNFQNPIEVEYSDGSKEKILIKFSDWWNDFPAFNEKIAFTCRCIRKENNKSSILQNQVSLFAEKIQVNLNKKIRRIILPDCPNIHVFAITLIG